MGGTWRERGERGGAKGREMKGRVGETERKYAEQHHSNTRATPREESTTQRLQSREDGKTEVREQEGRRGCVWGRSSGKEGNIVPEAAKPDGEETAV